MYTVCSERKHDIVKQINASNMLTLQLCNIVKILVWSYIERAWGGEGGVG